MKQIILLLILFSVTVIMLLFTLSGGRSSKEVVTVPVDFESYNIAPEITRAPLTVITNSGDIKDMTPLVRNNDTVIVSEDFYANTADDSMYRIYYFDGNANIMIYLYDENLAMARTYAEQQLQKVLPYSKEELCDMNIKVFTHPAVSKEYGNVNMGLSFCLQSITL
jgi:PAS domain-containing protein